MDIKAVVEEVFQKLYKGKYADKLFSKPENIENCIVLNKLMNAAPLPDKNKINKTCDDVFYEYLDYYKDKTNQKYFTLLTEFIILFKECYDIIKNKDNKEEKKEPVTCTISPEGLPDLCNEFYGEFLEPNNLFDFEDNERNEIIEMIQHFCIWLFKNEYTKSKLSLAS